LSVADTKCPKYDAGCLRNLSNSGGMCEVLLTAVNTLLIHPFILAYPTEVGTFEVKYSLQVMLFQRLVASVTKKLILQVPSILGVNLTGADLVEYLQHVSILYVHWPGV
jgi:hypothetical protein